LTAALVWWALLVVSGWLTFLPGFSERLKFTSALVAHSHLAMAGLLTSLGGLILAELTGRRTNRGAFLVWHAGVGVQVAALLLLGWNELENPAVYYRSEAWPHGLLLVRLVAGVAMTFASFRWLRDLTAP
jgi:cytochrome c oxidase cbb3-type subunit 1